MENRNSSPWPDERRIAVSLCFDGAFAEHLDVVAPLLNHFGIKATFFLSPMRVLENIQGWQAVANDGHEVANGCLLGVADDGRLPNWTLRMVEQDFHMTQEFLENLFEESESVSFAYPGGEPVCAQGSYVPVVNKSFRNARGGAKGANNLDCDLKNLRHEDLSDLTVAGFKLWKGSLIDEVASEDRPAAWHVFRFGKMFDGEDHGSLLIHELVVTHLADRRRDIWIAPISEVADRLRAYREEPAS